MWRSALKAVLHGCVMSVIEADKADLAGELKPSNNPNPGNVMSQ
jgi:hypothetical protein